MKAGKRPSVLIRGGLVVDPEASPPVRPADVLTDGERIAAVEPRIPASAADAALDASGCLVLPGGVDPHTHFELRVEGEHVGDDFASGTRAAVCGGTTTVIEHPGFGPAGCDIFHQMRVWRGLADGRAHADYGLHLVFQPESPDGAPWSPLTDLPEAAARGYVSGKAYTTYGGRLDDAHLLRLMAAMKAAGCLLAVHAENDAIPAWLRDRLPPRDPRSHPASRPAWCEAEAVSRVLALARTADAPLYLAHVSAADSLQAIRRARQAGQTVYAETCPQYLLLTQEAYAGPDGLRCVMAPPLRTDADREALWAALADGTVDVVATDHCAFSLTRKRALGAASVFRCPGGVPGVETRLPLLYTHGVLTGRFGPERLAELTASRPARLFGLRDKGRLAPGLDADVLILDPGLERPLTPDCLRQRADYCPYDSVPAPPGDLADGAARGWPRHVLLRGRVLVRDGEPLPGPATGRFVRRKPL